MFTAETIDYDTRSAIFSPNKVSLATVEGRVEPSFVLPADSPTPHDRYVLSENYEFREGTLRYDAATDEFYSTFRRGGQTVMMRFRKIPATPINRSSVSTSA